MKNHQKSDPIKSAIGLIMAGMSLIAVDQVIADDDRKAIPPGESVFGMSQGDWGAAWWQWAMSMPISFDEVDPIIHPFNDPTGEACGNGQGDGPVFFLAGTWIGPVERRCKVPAGQALFFPIINVECSTAEVDSD